MTPKQWLSIVADHGPLIHGAGMQIHHVCGRTYKHNKVLIGPWFIIPLPFELHDVSSNHPQNVTHYKHRFTDGYGLQSELFAEMVERLRDRGIEVPDQEILDAIKDTRK